ncbi:hypothetical protein HZH68_016489 [Vespula germanica]|uniref:Uncharacterized protein n=1 Tax=Vespula germanica TaxID=30212 RepID=A0A834J553_VESGE|nr:hypothetical protein HZH68_016489 [Vespula germanica]
MEERTCCRSTVEFGATEETTLSVTLFFGSPFATETATPVFPCISPSVLLLNKLSRIVRNMLKRKPKMRTSSPSREERRSTSSQLNWLYSEIIARPVGLRGASEILAKGESRFSPERSTSVSSFERVDRTKKSYKKKEGSPLQEEEQIFSIIAKRPEERSEEGRRSVRQTRRREILEGKMHLIVGNANEKLEHEALSTSSNRVSTSELDVLPGLDALK